VFGEHAPHLKARTLPKLLCLPADMGSYWFDGDALAFPHRYAGIHVALCNHTKTHNVRCKSFVTDTHGKKVHVQVNSEPIYVTVP